eukprot:3928733-Pyramimonas_sp.AAC.1
MGARHGTFIYVCKCAHHTLVNVALNPCWVDQPSLPNEMGDHVMQFRPLLPSIVLAVSQRLDCQPLIMNPKVEAACL